MAFLCRFEQVTKAIFIVFMFESKKRIAKIDFEIRFNI